MSNQPEWHLYMSNAPEHIDLIHELTHGEFNKINKRILNRWKEAGNTSPVPQEIKDAVWYKILYERDVYPTIKLATANFSNKSQPPAPFAGKVEISGHAFRDDNGFFKGFGATYMSALYWCKSDREKLRRNLTWLSSKGVNYIRILSGVGRPGDNYWVGREFSPFSPGSFEVMDTLFQDAEEFGMRIQYVLIDDILGMGTQDSRHFWLDKIAPWLEDRKSRVIFVEIANEYARFISDEDLADLCRHWKSISNIPLAPGSSYSAEDLTTLFQEQDFSVDLLTPHFDRSKGDEGYRPHRQPWHPQFYTGPNTRAFTNNEGIGPGSSVESEDRPGHLAMGMANTFAGKGAGYVYHSSSGVRGDHDFSEENNAENIMEAFQFVMKILPVDIANGLNSNHHWDTHPYKTDDQIWPDNGERGVVRAFGIAVGEKWYIFVMGMKKSYTITPRWDMRIKSYDIRNGDIIETLMLSKGQTHTFHPLPDGGRDFIHVTEGIQ